MNTVKNPAKQLQLERHFTDEETVIKEYEYHSEKFRARTIWFTGCVGVKIENDKVRVIDTKLGDDSPCLEFNHVEWRTFIYGVKNGNFELP